MNRQFSTFVEANWINTYKNSDQLWLADSLNWEKMSLNVFSDYFFFYHSFFTSQHILTDRITKLSYLDVTIIKSNFWNSNVQAIHSAFLNDIYLEFFNIYLPLLTSFCSNYQDVFSLILLSSPELIISFSDYFLNCFFNSSTHLVPTAIFDSFSSNLNCFSSSSLIVFFMFFTSVWFTVFFFLLNISLRWDISHAGFFNGFYYYFYSLSVESRVQLEAVIQTFVLFLLYGASSILTFDDDQEEVTAFLDVYFFYFFCTMLTYLVFKHSIHYFAFLENSISTGRSYKYAVLQFRNDILSSLAILLRSFILLFRFNVYDTLEDFFDSYYIFIGDFDDDEYMNELFFSLNNVFFFTIDNQDDRSFLHEDDNDFFYDFFTVYFFIWGKFVYFNLCIIELAARLSLAFYILYLVMFEVHSVNCTHEEDIFYTSKKYNVWSDYRFKHSTK